MGCDGIWEVKSNSEMVAWIRTRLEDKKMPVGKVIEELLDELVAKDSANSEYGMDNMSAILIKFDKTKKWYNAVISFIIIALLIRVFMDGWWICIFFREL